jgi:hypothetical protein
MIKVTIELLSLIFILSYLIMRIDEQLPTGTGIFDEEEHSHSSPN